ncbi:MAG TPA: penicillin-binding transpeptidase domain-containing protein [Spirochaetota bacterium]|nr:penicillin-binding transpeptidase domain-containing protein [Spirochaetota bacterium]
MLIMNNFFMRGALAPLLFTFIILFFPYNSVTHSQQNISNTLKINILSKHLGLLKKNKNRELTFYLPAGSVIRYDNSEFFAKSLSIKYSGDIYSIFSENRPLNFRKCVIYSENKSFLCRIKIDDNERSYPLPLEIVQDRDLLKIFTYESPEQYAIDSASAELGYMTPEKAEALYALALAIHGRSRIDSLTKKHHDSHFCDLTCCQTYKGRSGLNPVSGPFINTSVSQYGLFFHSSSGGRLFTESIFNKEKRKITPPKDIIYSENLLLSRNLHRAWSASIRRDELSSIICEGTKINVYGADYSHDSEIISLHTDKGLISMAPEEFRLKINRRNGWSFIKSNNYSIKSDDSVLHFTGSGLGHCTGISLEGAVQLAEKGYSRYEILEHYYPNLKYLRNGKPDQSYQYVTYNIRNGNIIFSSTGTSFLDRRIPCGSLFKLFTAIYLANERPDLFFNYKYNCTAKNPAPLPDHCWDRKGHGTTDIRSAVYNSCNIYFASLYNRISMDDFRKWFSSFVKSRGISMRLPAIKNEEKWSELLAGLNFSTAIAVRDIIKLTIFIRNPGRDISPEASAIIDDALKKTFTLGTAKPSVIKNDTQEKPADLYPEMWGKTGTVIAGTNSHHSYGLFTGGCDDTGIIVILRKGKGTEAAHLALSLLRQNNNK